MVTLLIDEVGYRVQLGMSEEIEGQAEARGAPESRALRLGQRAQGAGVPSGLPRTIWFLWLQGLERAPAVVRSCHESWQVHNPDWQLITLDQESMREVTTLDFTSPNLSREARNHQADLVRLDLLTHRGGVWADATCFCARPLDDWLPEFTRSGFFAFNRPGRDRPLSSWFLASRPGHLLTSRLFERLAAYWSESYFRRDDWRWLRYPLCGLLGLTSTTRSWWFSRPLRNWLGVSPYYDFHYMFERLLTDDPDCAQAWRAVPKISADGPHALYRDGLLAAPSPALQREITQRRIPVYKTSWKLGDLAAPPPGSSLAYLFEHGLRGSS